MERTKLDGRLEGGHDEKGERLTPHFPFPRSDGDMGEMWFGPLLFKGRHEFIFRREISA